MKFGIVNADASYSSSLQNLASATNAEKYRGFEMSQKYNSGIAREAVVMYSRGESIDKIMTVLRVDRQFVSRAIQEKHKHIVDKSQNIDYTGINPTGGY